MRKAESEPVIGDAEQRHAFEQAIVENGRRIDVVHKRVLKTDWINQVRAGNLEYLELCSLFRDSDSFTDPMRWLEKLQAMSIGKWPPRPVYRRHQGNQIFYFATNAARMDLFTEIIPPCRISLVAQESTGLSSPSFRSIETMSILPRNLVGELIRECDNIRNSIQKWVPNPRLIPLLKGNVEYLFDKVLKVMVPHFLINRCLNALNR